MGKLTLNEVLDRISDGPSISRSDIPPSLLSREVWLAERHMPGCPSESSALFASRREAIACALWLTAQDGRLPRGMQSALVRGGTYVGTSYVTTVGMHTLGALL